MSPIKWPWGTRAVMDKTGIVAPLAADHPVDLWICCRLDEPWTWKMLTNQGVAECVDCHADLIFRRSEKSPTDPHVQKICVRCAERRLNAPGP